MNLRLYIAIATIWTLFLVGAIVAGSSFWAILVIVWLGMIFLVLAIFIGNEEDDDQP